jgi:hypothetical protein
MRKLDLPSGAILTIHTATFAESKALYQAILKELKSVAMTHEGPMSLENMVKDAFCAGFSSADIERALWVCLRKCQYNDGTGSGDLRVDDQTFEPVKNRQDYVHVCVEVTKENVGPFVTSLYAEFKRGMLMNVKSQA